MAQFSKQEVIELATINVPHLVADAAFSWGCIVGVAFLFGLYGTWWAFAFAFLVIAARQHALGNFLHEASHYHLSRNKKLNDFIADVLFGHPVGLSVESYRNLHLPHHQHLGSIKKDAEVKDRLLIRRRLLLRTVLLCLAGVIAFKAVLNQAAGGQSASSAARILNLVHIALVQSAIFALFFVLAGAWSYLLLWILPLVTLTPLLITLRVIAEHQSIEYALSEMENHTTDIKPPFTRTIPGSLIECFFLGSVGFNFHHEHHLYPGIPYSNLPRAHKLLNERGHYQSIPHALVPTYRQALFQLILPDRQVSKNA